MNQDQYLAAVEWRLLDLPWRVRKTLVAELRLHLEELPAGDLVTQLGDPGTYAAELRAATELAPRRGPVAFLRARRPRNVAIAVALLAITGVLASAAVWASSYQPVARGSLGMNPLSAHAGALNEEVADFRQGRPFQVGVSIRNNGRFGIRVLSVPWREGILPFKARVFVGPRHVDVVGDIRPYKAFRPFTLTPGDERPILLRGTYTNCHQYTANTSVTLESLPVRTRFLLWNRTVGVSLLSRW